MENKHKRQYRELDDATKEKIKAGLRNRMKSATHRNNISTGMTEYWKTVPSKKTDDEPSPTEKGQIV